MRIRCSWTKGEARKLWHPHFAWLPIKLDSFWVWLEWIERRGTHHLCVYPVPGMPYQWWTWEYRDRTSRRT